MTHPNDTLQGRLYAHEREDQKHLRHCFGYWRMVEKRMIRERLIAEGHDPEALAFNFTVAREVERNHANDPTLREMQARRPPARSSPSLTLEEWRFLAEHFEGANDPLAASILAKAREVLR